MPCSYFLPRPKKWTEAVSIFSVESENPVPVRIMTGCGRKYD